MLKTVTISSAALSGPYRDAMLHKKNINAQQDAFFGLIIFLGKGLFTMPLKQFYK